MTHENVAFDGHIEVKAKYDAGIGRIRGMAATFAELNHHQKINGPSVLKAYLRKASARKIRVFKFRDLETRTCALDVVADYPKALFVAERFSLGIKKAEGWDRHVV